MIPRIEVTYRTADGDYRRQSCDFRDPGIVFPGDYAQAWALKNLPSGASLVSARTVWTTPELDCLMATTEGRSEDPPSLLICPIV